MGEAIDSVTPARGGLTDTVWLVRARSGTRVVLRHIDIDRWGETGRRHIRSEALGCRLLAAAEVPVPGLIASEAGGGSLGAYANLTSWLPGRVRLDPLGPAAVEELARAAARIHAVPVEAGDRPQDFQFWVPAHPTVPVWAERPRLWERALELFAGGPPPTPYGLLHRDFHPDNVLWDGDRMTGVIDWAETSWGPADLDVTHCRTNFAMLQDVAAADAFSAAYARHGGRVDPDPEASRYWAVSDILGFLPDPTSIIVALMATRPELSAGLVRRRLEGLLALVLDGGPG